MSALVVVSKNVVSVQPQIGRAKKLDRYAYLLQYPTVERWLRRKQPSTKYDYLRRYDSIQPRLEALTGCKNPDQFVSWAKSRDGTDVQDVVEAVSDTQRGTGRTIAIMALRSLLRKHGYNNLPKMEDAVTIPLEYHPGYRREDIQSLLSYLDLPIQKLYVLFAKDSGLRAQDILSLCYRHVKKDLEAGQEYVHLELEPIYYSRKKAAGITFIGPNTVRLLKQLINTGTVRTEPDAKIFPFQYESVRQFLVRAKKKADLDRKIQTSHGLRKFFENSLDRVGMDHHKKLQLEGHSQGVRIYYTDRNIDELRELYRQTYVHLDLSEAAVKEKAITDLERQVKELKDENLDLKERLEKVKDYEDRLARIERQLRKEAEKE